MTPAEEAHKLRVIGYLTKIRRLWQQAMQEGADMAQTVKGYDPDKPFNVANYPKTKATMDKWMAKLASETKILIEKGIDTEWYQANVKNDNLVKGWTKGKGKPPKEWMQHNEDALEAFKLRKEAGMSLSDRVWKLVDGQKAHLEMAIDMSLYDGKSAQLLSQDVRKYLKDPDKLFRRVRDAKGNLHLSKAAKAYHPGQGVYRSSYKNAMRLARTEHNLAYRYSDFYRTAQLDFVVGFEVHLSNNHTLNGEPFVDICDDLKGKYPKGFKFGGWHPQCRCYVTQILMDQDEFDMIEDRMLAGEDVSGYLSPNAVTAPPVGFNKWVKDNLKRSQGWKQQPYWIRDNFKGGNLSGGLSLKIPPQTFTKPSQADILAKAKQVSQEKYSQRVEAALKPYPNVPALDKFASDIKAAIEAGKSPNDIGKMVSKLEHKVTVKKKWEARRAANAKKWDKKPYLDELKTIDATYYDSPAIRALAKDIKTRLKTGQNKTYFDAQMKLLREKAEIKKAWDKRKAINQMGDLFPDAAAAVKQFGFEEVKATYDYVKSKIAFWKGKGYDIKEMVKKYEYEITYVETQKAKATWKLAQDAYKKQLEGAKAEYKKTVYAAEKKAITDSVKDAIDFSSTSASPMLHDLLNDLDNLIAADAPIKDLQFAAKQVNAKYKALLNLKEKRMGTKVPTAGTAKPTAGSDVGRAEAYTKARKDAARWEKDAISADNRYRRYAERDYANASAGERVAGYEYTTGSGKFNRPLSGYQQSWYNHKGIGKVSLNEEGAAREISDLTNWLERCKFDEDVWIQRGTDFSELNDLLGSKMNTMTKSQLQNMIGKDFEKPSFASCGAAKGMGFSSNEVILNIYCPKGTKMTYAEPWSHYGGRKEYGKWDGKKKQRHIYSEQEIIIQRGTTYRITKIEQRGSRWFIDVEITGQRAFI